MQNKEDVLTNLISVKRAISQAIISPKAILRRAETGCGKYGNRYSWIDEQLMTKGLYNNAADDCESVYGIRPFEPVEIPEIAYPTNEDTEKLKSVLKEIKQEIDVCVKNVRAEKISKIERGDRRVLKYPAVSKNQYSIIVNKK